MVTPTSLRLYRFWCDRCSMPNVAFLIWNDQTYFIKCVCVCVSLNMIWSMHAFSNKTRKTFHQVNIDQVGYIKMKFIWNLPMSDFHLKKVYIQNSRAYCIALSDSSFCRRWFYSYKQHNVHLFSFACKSTNFFFSHFPSQWIHFKLHVRDDKVKWA